MKNLRSPLVVLLGLLFGGLSNVELTSVYSAKPCNLLLSQLSPKAADKDDAPTPWRMIGKGATQLTGTKYVTSTVSTSQAFSVPKAIGGTKRKSIFRQLANLPLIYATFGASMSGTYFWLMKRLGRPYANRFCGTVLNHYLTAFFGFQIINRVIAKVLVKVLSNHKWSRPDLVADARELAAASNFTGIVYLSVIPMSQMNAAAFCARLNATDDVALVLLSSELVKKLTTQEIRAVIGHELGHSIHRDSAMNAHYLALLAGIAGAHRWGFKLFDMSHKRFGNFQMVKAMLAQVSSKHSAAELGNNTVYQELSTSVHQATNHLESSRQVGLVLFAAGQVSATLGLLIQRFISRDCEYAADAHAATLVGPRALMTSLQKLERGHPSGTDIALPAKPTKKNINTTSARSSRFFWPSVSRIFWWRGANSTTIYSSPTKRTTAIAHSTTIADYNATAGKANNSSAARHEAQKKQTKQPVSMSKPQPPPPLSFPSLNATESLLAANGTKDDVEIVAVRCMLTVLNRILSVFETIDKAVGRVQQSFRTHPPTSKRIKALAVIEQNMHETSTTPIAPVRKHSLSNNFFNKQFRFWFLPSE